MLLLNLRQYANPEGTLPADFDELVRESFGDLLESGVRSVNAALAQRQIALAGLALLAGILALALSSQKQLEPRRSCPTRSRRRAAAGTRRSPPRAGRRSSDACGPGLRLHRRAGQRRSGVANPVLPCDSRIYIQFGDKLALTQVIARVPSVVSRPTSSSRLALAGKLGLEGNEIIGWRYAR